MNLELIFLSKAEVWPESLNSEEWQEMEEAWFEFKSLMGRHLPGKHLIVGTKAVGALSHILKRDTVNRRAILDKLKSEHTVYIHEASPL